MKTHVPAAAVVLVVIVAFSTVFVVYWKGLLKEPQGEAGKMMGGGAGLPPPALPGLPEAAVTTLAGALPGTRLASQAGLVDASGAQARFDGPSAMAMGPGGDLWICDSRNHRLRRLTMQGAATTVAGSGTGSTSVGAFADGPADAARLWNPSGIAVAPSGDVYFTDAGNHRVRVLRGGQVRTLAGGDTPVDSFGLATGGLRNGPGAGARFRFPTGLVLRPDGTLLVVDTGNRRVCVVKPDGTTSTFADLGPAGGMAPCGIALATDGRVLVADPAASRIFTISPQGQAAPLPEARSAEVFWRKPTALAVRPDGLIYIADAGSHAILRLRPGGAPELLAGTVTRPEPTAGYYDGTGDKAMFAAPAALVLEPSGALYVADYGNNAIRKVVVGKPPTKGARHAH